MIVSCNGCPNPQKQLSSNTYYLPGFQCGSELPPDLMLQWSINTKHLPGFQRGSELLSSLIHCSSSSSVRRAPRMSLFLSPSLEVSF
jgi:hypothetical protein